MSESATPILDLEQPPPPLPGNLHLYLVGFTTGVLVLSFLFLRDNNQLPEWHWPAVNGLLLFPMFWLGIAIHEAAHAITGRLVGLEFGGISIAGFVFLKSGTRWACRFELRNLFGGCFLPLSGKVGFECSKWAWMVAAGPLASTSFALISGWLCALYGSGHWAWLGTLFWTSLFLSFVSLIPATNGVNQSDGARLWQLLRHPQQARSWIAILAVQTEDAEGILPRHWSRRHVEQMLSVPPTGPEYAHCQLMVFYRLIDEGEETAALPFLERSLSGLRRVGKPYRQVVFIEASCACASIQKNPERAKEWRKRAIALMKPRSIDALDAEIAIAEGRFELALKHLEAAQAHLDRYRLDSGLARFAREQWTRSAELCRATLQQTGR
ncbi:MAG: M50 family metallopeptidase [Acidobacteria bacterium]|nr:M50 family metallopeptidase [Acidobacteriota bacterium]